MDPIASIIPSKEEFTRTLQFEVPLLLELVSRWPVEYRTLVSVYFHEYNRYARLIGVLRYSPLHFHFDLHLSIEFADILVWHTSDEACSNAYFLAADKEPELYLFIQEHKEWLL